MSTTILIAEDHHLIRTGLHAAIERDGAYLVVGHALDGRDALQKTLTLQPDLLLLDMRLPGSNGTDVAAQVRRQRPQQRILAIADSGSDIEVSEALRAGCGGYLLTDASQDETLQAVRSVIGGRRYISHELADALLSDALRTRAPSHGLRVWDSLSARERAVFRLIAEGGTNRSAAATLNLSPKTIEKHRANLMRKLCARSAVELMMLAVEMGLVHRPKVHLPGGTALGAAPRNGHGSPLAMAAGGE